MSYAPDPSEIFDRAVEEGNRRLDQSLLELVATSFIAGFTIVFGMVGLAIAEAALEPQFDGVAKLAGALTFAIGVVFLIVGRTELFNENFFDPTAAAFDRSGSWLIGPLLRLWVVTFALNLVGGGLFALVFAIHGVLGPGAAGVLREFTETTVSHSVPAWFGSAIAGGALVSMLSFLVEAVDSVGSRISISYAVGFLLALGPFEHVVVTMIHVFFGVLFGAHVTLGAFVTMTAVITVGNFVGGLGLVTFTHAAQAVGARQSDE